MSFAALEPHGKRLAATTLRRLFAEDPVRFHAFSATFDDVTLDFSKEKIDREALAALLALADEKGVAQRRDAMARGEPINATEGRAVLHMALRARPGDGWKVAGRSVGVEVLSVFDAVCAFADSIRTGAYAPSGRRITDVVNIGIGGSDLGPAMVTRALTPFRGGGPRLHFVSNIDGAHLAETLAELDPATTFLVIASKTFTTLETMTNARSAKAWLVAALGETRANTHMGAVSSDLDRTAAFGIDPTRVFGFWDWVGGRYSVWSAIGLPIAIAIGAENFRSFLAGARSLDRHFLETPFERNLPVLLALIGIWRRNVMGCPTVALIPYDQRLEYFPRYVQQLDMESNGKRVTREGKPVSEATGPVVWGAPGTNAQHSFFQLLHQGTDVVPVDFLLAANPIDASREHHALLSANCLAQAEALAFGKTAQEVEVQMREKGADAAAVRRLTPHRTFPGDRPSTILLYKALTPYTLGRLVALYEHKVFVEGVLWDINSFDQWGVELGKELAGALVPILKGEAVLNNGKDSSTASLVARWQALRTG